MSKITKANEKSRTKYKKQTKTGNNKQIMRKPYRPEKKTYKAVNVKIQINYQKRGESSNMTKSHPCTSTFNRFGVWGSAKAPRGSQSQSKQIEKKKADMDGTQQNGRKWHIITKP